MNVLRISTWKPVLCMIMLLVSLTGVPQAGNVPINNPGFEALALAPSNWTAQSCWVGDPTCVQTPTTVLSWSVAGVTAGTWRPTAASYPGGVPEGSNIAYAVGGASISQVLTDVLVAGATYTLEVDVGSLSVVPPGYAVQLWAGATLLAEDVNGLTPAPGTFETSILEVTTTAGDPGIGENLEIVLINSSSAVYFDNVILMSDALPANTNTLLGVNALDNNTTGGENVAVGFDALFSNTEGTANTAVGFGALAGNTEGFGNTAIGRDALEGNTTGQGNVAIGDTVLPVNSEGGLNIGIGTNALFSNTTGWANIAIGSGALLDNTDGFDNIAIGRSALDFNMGGSNNVAIGLLSGVNNTSGDNNLYLLNEAVAAESNTIRIGTPLGFGLDLVSHTSTFIAGISGVDVGAGATGVFVNADGQLGTLASAKRFKEAVRDMGEASSAIMRLRPVTFRYRKEHSKGVRPLQYGLIAEEVAELYPELVVYSRTGEPETVQYHKVNAMLLNEVQKQHRKIQGQHDQIRMQQQRMDRLEGILAGLTARLRTIEAERVALAK